MRKLRRPVLVLGLLLFALPLLSCGANPTVDNPPSSPTAPTSPLLIRSSPSSAPGPSGTTTPLSSRQPTGTARPTWPPSSTPEPVLTLTPKVPWSTRTPSGSRQILLFSEGDGLHQFVIDPQTLSLSSPAVLPTGSFDGAYPSPDGRYIAFNVSHEGGIDTSVFDLTLQRSILFQVDELWMQEARYLTWTPQGDLLVASPYVGPGLWRLDVRTPEEDHFFFGSDPCAQCYLSAAIPPDGKTILYSYYLGREGSQLWEMNTDGSNRTLLVGKTGSYMAALTFSPNGSQIAYVGGGVWVMDPNGQNRRQLSTSFADGQGHIPVWSPDGSWLAFVSNDGDDKLSGQYFNNIHLVEVATGTEWELLPLEGYHNYDPYWSPDGDRLVFVSDRSGADEIWVINQDGTGLQQLTKDGKKKRFPLWLYP